MSEYQLCKNKDFVARRKHIQKGAKRSLGKFVNKNHQEVRRVFIEEIQRTFPCQEKQQMYCDVTGYPCSHTHPKYGLHYLNMEVFCYLNGLNQQQRNNWLSLKNLAPV